MPVQVVPHMYRMLADEVQWALDEVGTLPAALFLAQRLIPP